MEPMLPIREKIEALIIRMAKASKMYSIYQSDHRLANEICIQVHQLLEDILVMRNDITIGIISNELAFEKKPFIETSAKISDFIDRLTEKGLKKITFSQGITKEDIFGFMNIVSEVCRHRRPFEVTLKQFEAKKIAQIKIGHISIEEEELLLYGTDDVKQLTNKSFERGVKMIERQVQNIMNNKPVDIESVRLIAAAFVNCLLVNKSLLMMLTSIKLDNEEKYTHNLIVCVFTLLQAEMLGIDRKYFSDISSAALLHNIGMLYSEQAKGDQDPEKLDAAAIKEIIRNGVKILISTDDATPLAAVAALEYFIPYEKSKEGNPIYNKGLNLVSMFITIARYYDKLRSRPEYQVDGGLEKIHDKMMSMGGKQLNPDLLYNFFNVIGVYPPGTLVELDTKEVGIVIRSSVMDIRRPSVEIVYDASGHKLAQSVTINLMERNRQGKFIKTIQKSLAAREDSDITASIKI